MVKSLQINQMKYANQSSMPTTLEMVGKITPIKKHTGMCAFIFSMVDLVAQTMLDVFYEFFQK